MGTFFSTFQIKNNRTKPDFEKTFTDYMKNKGLVPVSAEDAGYSVVLAFSKDSPWVTFCPSYDAGYDSEARELAKAMKTVCINTSVYDSDCLELYLYDAATEREDKVMSGRCEEYCEPEEGENYEGNPDCWRPLLAEGATWEQLTEIWRTDYVFAEEALSHMAPLLAMDAKNVAMDYRFWQDIEPDDANIVTLHFKGTATPQVALIEEGPSMISVWSADHMLLADRTYEMKFKNAGGVSQGLTVMMTGDCFKDDSVVVEEVSIDSFTAKGQREQTANGQYHVRFDFDDFVLPKGFDLRQFSPKNLKVLDKYILCIRFMAKVNSGAKHEFSLHVIPQANWDDGRYSFPARVFASLIDIDKHYGRI